MDPLQFYKSLADETRLRCLLLIEGEGELCVCELTTALAETQPKVSRHLAQLRAGGLLSDRREGKWVYYQLDAALPSWARQVLRQTASANAGFLAENRARLGAMQGRPGRVCA